ncbi:VOC family protein [Amycolatopsis alkalitolerans]|uniref:VOC family protein n=1 Tax=Amycolatopsis alkalitolerans TaxID=2547244 RepID=A0A5C4LY86_9PSEU|nr:VOC family protein [Amycolatopsis alkalitolerans]
MTSTVLDTPDPRGLAEFYRAFLGWPVASEDPTWVTLRPEGGGAGLSFQLEPRYSPPIWPSRPDEQQMQLHLDFEVDDLEATGAIVEAAGAVLAEFQPQDDTRVYLDPAGHPFCLWVRT